MGSIMSIKSLLLKALILLSTISFSQEEVLRLLIWEGHAPEFFVRNFEKSIKDKYNKNVKLDISYVTSSDDFYSDVRKKNIDLVMISHQQFRDDRYDYIKHKLFLPLNIENISNFKFVIPELQKAEYLYENDRVYGCPASQGPYGLVYNSSLIDKEPSSWNILWDPKYKGKYVIAANEYIYNITITALALGYPIESTYDVDSINNKEFKDKLRELAHGANSFWVGVDTPADLTGMSLATSWGDSLAPLNRQGESWVMAEPFEGMPAWIDNYAITWALKDKPFLRKVAEEYIDAILSPEYQVEIITRKMSLTPIITNIEYLLTKEENQRLHLDAPDFLSENRILQHTYSVRDRNGLKLFWQRAMEGLNVE